MNLIPDPAPSLDPSEGQDPKPSGTPSGDGEAGARPEWVPEDAWDPEAGAPLLDKLGEAFQSKGKDADVPAEASAYTAPEVEGLKAEEITGNLTYQMMAKAAHAAGMGQERFAKLSKDWIEEAIAAGETTAAEEKKLLGENADARLKAVADWAGSKVDADEFKALQGALSTAVGVKALEKLMTAGGSTASRDVPKPAPTVETEDEIKALMASDAYSGPPGKRDPAVIKKVDAWYAAKYAPKPGT